MSDTTDGSNPGDGPQGGSRSTPVAAIAGAVVLVGLAGFAIYRRATAPAPAGAAVPAAAEGAAADAAGESTSTLPDDPDAPRGDPARRERPNPVQTQVIGTPITAQAPPRLSPEASILAERYRCVCGCNDPLGLCTCTLARGSVEMKATLEDLAGKHLLPAEIDRAMTEKYGAAVLLSNPAPPQTQPSHVTGAPGKQKSP